MTEPEEEREQQQRSSVGQSQEAQWTDEGKLVSNTLGPDNGRLLLCVIVRSSHYERKQNNFLHGRTLILVFLNQIGKKGLDVGKFLVALFSMLASAMNQPFSYPEDYISDPDSNLILVTRLCSYIWFGLSRLPILFPGRVEVRAGKVDLEHAEDERGAVPAEPVHHVSRAAQEEVPGEEA